MKIKRPLSEQPLPKHAKKVFKGVLFDIYQWKQKLFNGKFATFEKLRRQDSVSVIPVTVDGRIITTRQKQPGTKTFLTFAGGQIDKGESSLKAAERELLEETGYKAKKWEVWYSVQPFSKIDWAVYVFIAKGCIKVNRPTLDGGEKIKVELISFKNFCNLLEEGTIPYQDMRLKVMEARLNSSKMKKLSKLLLEQ